MDSPTGPHIILPGVPSRSAVENTSSWLQGVSSEDESHSNYHNSWAQELETTRGETANPSRNPGKASGNGGSAKGSLSRTRSMSSKNGHVHNSWVQTTTSDGEKKLAEYETDWSQELARHEKITNRRPTRATNREKYEAETLPEIQMVAPKMSDNWEHASPKIGQRNRAVTEPAHSAIIFGTGMSPTKTGSYGVIGMAELKEPHGFARVVSHQAVLETAANEQYPPEYSPSDYGGVWENDPKVGLTLPPFSPDMRNAATISNVNETIDQRPRPAADHFVPRLTATSLDSLASSDPTVNRKYHPSAEVLPLFSSDRKVNSVPPPPASFSEYESTKAFDFARMEQSLHHHIDAQFERLSRLVVERSDKVVDGLTKMIETSEETLRKGLRASIKQDLVALKNEFENLGHDLHGISANSLESKRALQAMNSRVASLEVSVREAACQCRDPRYRQNALIMSATMPDTSVAHQQIDSQSKLDMGQLIQTPVGQKEAEENLEEIAVDGGHEDPVTATEPDACDSGEEEPAIPLSIRGPNGVLYEVPSFLTADENSDAVVNLLPTEEPMPVPGIRGPNGVLYELPSFMTIGEDGQPEVIPEQDSTLEAFMTIGENGQPEVIAEQDSTIEANQVATVLGWVEGIDGETDIEFAITSMLSCIVPSEHPE